MRSNVFSLALLVLLALLLPNNAAGDTFDWTFTGSSATSFGGSGVLTATSVPGTDYDIVTSMSGTLGRVDGVTMDITGVVAPGVRGNDNLIYPAGDGAAFSGALLDQFGILFDGPVFGPNVVPGDAEWFIFAVNPPPDCPQCYLVAPPLVAGTFAITQANAPEPGTFGLILEGLMAIGLLVGLTRHSNIVKPANPSIGF